MNIEIPLYKQERDNTCALACLRMVLAAFGTHVPESELAAHVTLEPRGTPIDLLERLARQFRLDAEIQNATVEQITQMLADGKLPIAYIDREIFDLTPSRRVHHSLRDSVIHTVVPVVVTSKSVTFHDPRPPSVTRKSMRLFRRAYEGLGGACVVCGAPSR